MDFFIGIFYIAALGLTGFIVYLGIKNGIKNARPKPAGDDTEFKTYCATLNNTEMHNLIISGGNSADRFLAVTSILNEASKRSIPTIVLHSGFAPFNQFSQNTFYDPCVDKDSDEIAEIFTDAATNALNIDSVVHSSLKLIADILQAVKGSITLSDILAFPCDDVIGYLDDIKTNSISESQYDKFKQRYNNPAVRDNMQRLLPLFAKLKTLAQKNKSAQPINFQQAVMDRKILFFDVLSDSNAVLKELVFADINRLTEFGKFWVVTEGISFIGKAESKVDTVFVKNQNNITLIYSGEDVPSLTAQTENTFETLTGGNSQLLLFAHTSAASAEKWSGHFGKEHKTKISKKVDKSAFIGVKQGQGDEISTEQDYKFPPQHFMHSAKTTDLNNRPVVWGLKENECYFIKGNNAIVGTEATGTGLLASAGFGQMMQTVSLPKIILNPTALMIETQATVVS